MTRAAPDNERFLSRWSRLKRAQAESAGGSSAGETKPVERTPDGSAVASAPIAAHATSAADASTITGRADVSATQALPAIDSLTMDSDYAQFFQPKVPESLRRAAVKKLFADPHFNIMDGLDTYIADYTKSDPIPPDMLAKMWNLRDIVDHPSNRKPEVAEAEAAALPSAIDEAAAGTASAIQDEAVSPDPTCRPPEGGDPATFDPIRQGELGDAATASKSPCRSRLRGNDRCD